MIKNTILNKDYIFKNLTNDTVKVLEQDGKVYEKQIPVEFRWTHGATDYHLGDGLLIYSIITFLSMDSFNIFISPSLVYM